MSWHSLAESVVLQITNKRVSITLPLEVVLQPLGLCCKAAWDCCLLEGRKMQAVCGRASLRPKECKQGGTFSFSLLPPLLLHHLTSLTTPFPSSQSSPSFSFPPLHPLPCFLLYPPLSRTLSDPSFFSCVSHIPSNFSSIFPKAL